MRFEIKKTALNKGGIYQFFSWEIHYWKSTLIKTGNSHPVHWPTSNKLNHQFLYLESGTNDDFHFSPNHKSSRLENITRGLLQQNAQIIQ